MNFQGLKLLAMLFDPRITRVPLRVTRQLAKAGHRRLPGRVADELTGTSPVRVNTFAFLRRYLRGERLTRHRGQWVLNSFLPPFPGRAYERMFHNLLSGRRLSPVSAYLAVTVRCPFDCRHCSLKKRPVKEPSTERQLDTVAQLHELGCSVIGFTGGEPLLRPDLPELVGAAVSGGAAAVVFSSGAGLTPELAGKLRAAGLWAFCVSLDSPDPAEVAALRGRADAYESAIEAIRVSKQAGFYTMTGTLATPELVRSGRYRALYELACRLRVDEFRLIEPMPCGNYFRADDGCFLQPDEVAVLRRFHTETNRRGGYSKVCAFNQVESPEYFGCGGGTQHLFIDPAGEVCPCDFTPLSFGNVASAPLAELWARMNAAMGNPRRHCFVQRHRELLRRFAGEGAALPLPPETSEAVCRAAGPEDFPDYFQLVTGRRR